MGAELEWTVHHMDDPARPVRAARLVAALGRHAPATLSPPSPHAPLPNGSLVSVEPGGQVEISTPPLGTLGGLLDAAAGDAATLAVLLRDAGLVMGRHGTDPYRLPRRIVDTPRYRAMQAAFDRIGPHGARMMCSTAGLQVCVDAGTAGRIAARWAALHLLGPVLVALFANSPRLCGRDTGWAASRLPVLFGTAPARMLPAPVTADPAAAWARRALRAPVICVRRPGGCWDAPPQMTFADWIDGALPQPPATADLDYHLSTLFPPVRPRGYLEVRYLDAQPGQGWITPVALLAALMSDEPAVDQALEACGPAAGLWLPAARRGLADPRLARAARVITQLGTSALSRTAGLPAGLAERVADDLDHRLRRPAAR